MRLLLQDVEYKKSIFITIAMLTISLCIAIAGNSNSAQESYQEPKANKSWQSAIIRSVDTQEKVVALTYDDGPDPRFTPQILQVLRQQGVKATFFMVGMLMEVHPEIVKAVAADGHVIGNHTYSHPYVFSSERYEQVAYEIGSCESIIERLTGKKPALFRPPKGLLKPSIIGALTCRNYQVVLWSICVDHRDAQTPEDMAKRVVDNVKPGSIILLHDGRFGTRWKDVIATRLIIESLKKKGYSFLTLPELLELNKPKAHIQRQAEPLKRGFSSNSNNNRGLKVPAVSRKNLKITKFKN